jgi:hypothetical protein
MVEVARYCERERGIDGKLARGWWPNPSKNVIKLST